MSVFDLFIVWIILTGLVIASVGSVVFTVGSFIYWLIRRLWRRI